MKSVVQCITFLAVIVHEINGHGRLRVPPGRSTAWREGFDVPENYNDNQLNCGGYSNQWDNHDGACGICGDPYQGPRENEAGEKYATGTIVKSYTAGSVISVTIEITANHKGWHEFRLCKNDDPTSVITQECLDEHLLADYDSGETRLYMDVIEEQEYTWSFQLPPDLTCSQCVLQWKWNCGNNWGTDPDGTSGVGHGPQEQFYGCADISISSGGQMSTTTTTNVPVETTTITTTGRTESSTATSTTTTAYTTTGATTTTAASGDLQCRAAGDYIGVPGMKEWCTVNCAAGNCPETHCTCEPGGNQGENEVLSTGTCISIGSVASDDWCKNNCFHDPPNCPTYLCECT